MTEEEKGDFKKTMALRFRTAWRHISQAKVKHPNCGWIKKLFEEGLAQQPAEGLAQEPAEGLAQQPAQGLAQQPAQGLAQQPAKEFFYGFDWELRKVWRIEAGGEHKELAVKVDTFTGKEHPVAWFANEPEGVEIKAVLNSELAACKLAQGKVTWLGAAPDGAKLRVARCLEPKLDIVFF